MKQYVKTFESFYNQYNRYNRLHESNEEITTYDKDMSTVLSLVDDLEFILNLNSNEFSELFNDSHTPEQVIYYILRKGIAQLTGSGLNQTITNNYKDVLNNGRFKDTLVFPILMSTDNNYSFSKLSEYSIKIPNLNSENYTENYFETTLDTILNDNKFFGDIVEFFGDSIDNDGYDYITNNDIGKANSIYEAGKIEEAFNEFLKENKNQMFAQAFNEFLPKKRQTDTVLRTSGGTKSDWKKEKLEEWLDNINAYLNKRFTISSLISKLSQQDSAFISKTQNDGLGINIENMPDLPNTY